MSKGKLCVITRTDDPHAYFMGLYKTQTGGSISTWSSDIVDGFQFESMAAAKRFIALRMPKPVSPFCRVKALDIPQKRGVYLSCLMCLVLAFSSS